MTPALPDLLETAPRHGSRIALIHREGDVTYDDLAERVATAAGGLADAGVSGGMHVVSVMHNAVDSVVAFHAAMRCGAIVVALGGGAGPLDIAHAIARTSPHLCLAPGHRVAELGLQHSSVPWVARPEGSPRPGAPTQRDDPCLVLFTSGTTSRPKGVVHSRRTLGAAAENFTTAARLTADDRIFLVSPLASITGILQALCMAPMLGAAVVLEDRFDPSASLDLLLDAGGTFYGGPDVVLARLFATARDRGIDRVGLRTVSLGGTMLDPALLREAEDDFGVGVTRAYGSSEAPFSTATPIGDPTDLRLDSDGVALDGVEVRTGTKNDPSELALRGPHVMLRYLDDEDNEAAFDDGWYCTGDIAEITDGGRIRIVGRIKDVAIRNGVKIALPEVESAVAALDGIDRCVAYRVADPQTGEHVGIAVVASSAPELDDINRSLLASGMTKSKLPEEMVVWTGPFPETATGKLRRPAIADRARDETRQVVARLAK